MLKAVSQTSLLENTRGAVFSFVAQTSNDENLKIKARKAAELQLDLVKKYNSEMDTFWQHTWDKHSNELTKQKRDELNSKNESYKKGGMNAADLDYYLEQAFIKSGLVSQADTVRFYELKSNLDTAFKAAFNDMGDVFPESLYDTGIGFHGVDLSKLSPSQRQAIQKGDIVEDLYIKGRRNAYFFISKTIEDIARSVRQ